MSVIEGWNRKRNNVESIHCNYANDLVEQHKQSGVVTPIYTCGACRTCCYAEQTRLQYVFYDACTPGSSMPTANYRQSMASGSNNYIFVAILKK